MAKVKSKNVSCITKRHHKRLRRVEIEKMKKNFIPTRPLAAVKEDQPLNPKFQRIEHYRDESPTTEQTHPVTETVLSRLTLRLTSKSNATSNSDNYINSESMEIISEEDDKKSDITTELRQWVIESCVAKMWVNRLLKILRRYGHEELPADFRTLLCTPRTIRCIDVAPGKYYHFGLMSGLKKSIDPNLFSKGYFPKDKIPNEILYNVNIDGLPLAKSSSDQIWPILGSICIDFYTEPFAIGIYSGKEKPRDCDEFLSDLIEDVNMTQQNGIIVDKKCISCKLNVFTCDAPAKAFITGTKGHNAYHGCGKCTQEGKFVLNRVTYPETKAPLRSDQSFSRKTDENHHKRKSILEKIENLGMVSQFPLDYMHLICLGVMKKLISFWIRGKKNIRMSDSSIATANDRLLSLKHLTPKEFLRTPRSLHEFDRFKATEFRQILLYSGPIIFFNCLDSKKYDHFLSLSIAIRILVSKTSSTYFYDYAKSLLIYFVENFGKVYGHEFTSYNVHNLLHICDDVKLLGPLDTYSCFKFENYLQKLKFKIKTSGRSLSQIVNRLIEESMISKQFERKNYPIIVFFKHNNNHEIKSIKSLTYEHFFLNTKTGNNCICTISKQIILIETITYVKDKSILLSGKNFINERPFFIKPCDSTIFSIMVIKHAIYKNVTINAIEIAQKCVLIPISEEESITIPLVHQL